MKQSIYNYEIKKCSLCGKSFLPAPFHMYKTKNGLYCSYSCYRKCGGDPDKNKYGKKIKRRRRVL